MSFQTFIDLSQSAAITLLGISQIIAANTRGRR